MHDRLTDKQSVSSCRIIKKETVVYLKAEEYLNFPTDIHRLSVRPTGDC